MERNIENIEKNNKLHVGKVYRISAIYALINL